MSDIIQALKTEIAPVPILDPMYTGFMGSVEKEVEVVVKSKDFDRGFRFLNDMLILGKGASDASGMMLNGMDGIWVPAEHDGEEFDDAVRRITGLDPETVRRRLKVQRMIPKIPDEFREEIQAQGFKQQIQIANLYEEGYEISHDNLIELAEAVDETETGRIARKIKNVEPRTNWLSLTMDGDGRVFVHSVRGSRELTRFPIEDKDPDIQKAIARLVNGKVKRTSEY